MRDRIIRKSMQKVVPKRRVQIKYLGELLRQCGRGDIKYGGVTNIKVLKKNMQQNCTPVYV